MVLQYSVSSLLPASLCVLILTALAASGCQDPCVALAERICNCEPTPADRRSCRADRVVNRQSQVEINDEDRAFCEAKLEICECADVDENRLDQCGFVIQPENE